MTDRPVTSVPGPAQIPAIPARLEPDAIGVIKDTIIGLASSAPAATVGLTLAAPGTSITRPLGPPRHQRPIGTTISPIVSVRPRPC